MNRLRETRQWFGLVIGYSLPLLGLAQSLPPDSVRHRIILIGDAGRLQQGRNPVIDAVLARHDMHNTQTTLVYLGDNLYPRGLPTETDVDYPALTDVLHYLVTPGLANSNSGKPSKVLFIPGNNDWAQGRYDGRERVQRQGRWLDSLHAPTIRMLPANGCPGPEEIHLSDRLVLVLLDSQWWLHPYDKPGAESDCACKTESEVLARLSDIAHRNHDKVIVVATHHPFRSYGIHGGFFRLREHLFPLTDLSPKLYVPLPGIGSLYPLVRGLFGNVQDLAHPIYHQMVRAIETTLAPAPNVMFVSGHDHSLQYILDGNRPYIVSGTGINRERVKAGKKAQFVSSNWGYVVLDEQIDGRLTVTFYTVNETDSVTEAHSATLFHLPSGPKPITNQPPTSRKENPDSVQVAIAPAYDRAGRLQRWLLGNNYRREWATPVSLPVFDLTRTLGGFTILQRGGGMQTKSLRLEDQTGREWVLRSVQKDPVNALPPALRQTIAKDILQDEISASFPFAPLTVPTLANAAGVPHANPTLVFIPDDPTLGIYRADFANTVGLLEERSPVEGKTISTAKVIDALADDNDNRVDQRALLRARLLDLLIGDWDRHEDQWRWGIRKTDTGREYYPIPRDRDQVFFRADGLLPTLAALPWIQPKFQGFGPKLANVKGAMFNARYVDRLFLSELSAEDWLTEITDLQTVLTDSVLQRAIDQLPPPVRSITGERLLKTLKIRRGWLLREAMTYYRFLAKKVDIPGSDKTELFRVENLKDNKVAVSVFKVTKNNTVAQRMYYRVFDAAVTREICLYGQKGDDRFEVSGSQKVRARVRLIGGKGNDRFVVTGKPSRPLIYDRLTEANNLPAPGTARRRLGSDEAVNRYDPHAFRYDRLAPLLTGGYNPDDGVLAGIGVDWTKQGFRKAPFAAHHRLLISRALATNATAFNYTSTFTDLIGQNDLVFNATARAPNNVANFFGPGNESSYDKSRRIRYYRTRYNLSNVSVLLKRPLGNHIQVTLGPVFQHFTLDSTNNKGRFINTYLPEQPTSLRLEQSYGGLQTSITLDTRTNPTQPQNGVYWNTTLLNLWGFGKQGGQLTQLQTDFTLYTKLGSGDRFVLANRLGGGLTYGSPAFYQLLYLGGHDNLRGFRTYRFAGNHLLYHTIEARLKLFSFQSFLFPGSIGLLAFNDLGRVWLRGETSRRWHDGYGGGLYITPASLLVVTTSVGFSDEGILPYISLGFRF
ncbi:BamA/TamA family outer membrane protein [Spirosoma sp. SC4-14]|uniref:BamA/TamA family outer membrane protein n=1 Tax=Spirosoma sp. SC4-14 TaxID=3128900 RepID=UPI0030D1AC53